MNTTAVDPRNILVETHGRVGIARLNRPQRLNALNDALAAELCAALAAFDADPGIAVMIITGNDKAFAAGADIGAMTEWDYPKVYADNFISRWESMKHIRKPVIAAVAGYALGGGCELAMMCDMIIAADTARFGQPEITIGTIPGMGGTQRLPRAVGKSESDGLVSHRAPSSTPPKLERAGLVSRVVAADQLEAEALAIAEKIASYSLPLILKIKEAINRAYESSLSEGLLFERREFHSTFALDDQKEGMRAFVDKRKPEFKNR